MPKTMDEGISRRRFLKYIGAAIVAATGAGIGYNLYTKNKREETSVPIQTLTQQTETEIKTSTIVTSEPNSNAIKIENYLKLLKSKGYHADLAEAWMYLPEFDYNESTVRATEEFTRLFLDSDNPEVEEAGELIIKGGTPSKEDFSYKVPDWNIELQVLRWLAEQNEFKRNDTLAQAIAMVNGLWVTIGDDQIRKAVYKDTNDLLNFFRETNEIQKTKGYYQLENYPLEAKVCLAWTGSENIAYYVMDILNRYYTRGTREKISNDNYSRITVNIETLKEMREFVFNKWVKK